MNTLSNSGARTSASTASARSHRWQSSRWYRVSAGCVSSDIGSAARYGGGRPKARVE